MLQSQMWMDLSGGLHNWPHANKEFLWGLAVILTLIGRSMEGVGLVVQKHAHRTIENGTPDNEEEGRPNCCCSQWLSGYCKDKTWAIGFLIYLAGHILCWVSMAMGTQTVLSCLMCCCTATTVLLSPIVLRETVTTFRFCSILMMLFGATWVTLYGPRNTEVYTVDVLRKEFRNPAFQEISALVALALVGFAGVALFEKRREESQHKSSKNDSSRVQCPISDFSLTVISAMVGWYSVLFGKCTSGLLFTSWHYREMQFLTWEAWVMTAALLITAVAQVHFLNLALAEGDANKIVPAYESMAMVGQIFIGGIFFEELWTLSPSGHMNFWLGVASVIIGIMGVVQKEPDVEFLRQPIISPGTIQSLEGIARPNFHQGPLEGVKGQHQKENADCGSNDNI